MNTRDKYSVLYRLNMLLIVKNKSLKISPSDVVSITKINNYDTMTYPIIRIRLYSDISILEQLVEFPDDISIQLALDGGIYKICENADNNNLQIVDAVNNLSFEMKVYLENKNTPVSDSDRYIDGILIKSDLNNNVKVPIELYCYNENMIHLMRQKSLSIYKDISMESTIRDMLNRCGIMNIHIDESINQTRYDQILIPNLNINQSLAYLDLHYGLYQKGGQVYGDFDKFYVCDADSNNKTKPLSIYVQSYKSNDEIRGMIKLDNRQYGMITQSPNVSVITETDVERALNAPTINSININDLSIKSEELKRLYSNENVVQNTYNDRMSISNNNIYTPDLLHKAKNKYIASCMAARINENITRVDVSGSGFDIGKIKINSRFNLIFESPIRGLSMNMVYRPTYVCNTLTNLNGDLFTSQTTMNLCSN